MKKLISMVRFRRIAMTALAASSLLNVSASTLRKEIHSGWKFRQARLSNWYPATVPGVVHTDLMDNRIIEDFFLV